jgi:uncharacterized protein with von Willebrand factor type A (vWA) domain
MKRATVGSSPSWTASTVAARPAQIGFEGDGFAYDNERPRHVVDLPAFEIDRLHRSCRRLIWLNPLLASENYEPLCKGMQAALPYIDLFLSVHNLNSLVALGRTLQKMVA